MSDTQRAESDSLIRPKLFVCEAASMVAEIRSYDCSICVLFCVPRTILTRYLRASTNAVSSAGNRFRECASSIMTQQGRCPDVVTLVPISLPNKTLNQAACVLLSASRVLCVEVIKRQQRRCCAHSRNVNRRPSHCSSVGNSFKEAPTSDSVA